MNRPQDEKRLDELVRDLAADYNAPSGELDEDRRAAIFARIQEGRQQRNRRRTPAPRARRWQWAVAMAAVLVIGFMLGRWQPRLEGGETPEQVAVDQPMPETDGRTPVAYQYAARDFLERTDNLLVMLQRAAYSPDANTPFGLATNDPTVGWAQALLRETRLLQDSPATEGDPQLCQLLEDLELLLAQIVRAAGDNQDLERSPVTSPETLQRVRGEIGRNTLMNEI
jgi:hypothetical protein